MNIIRHQKPPLTPQVHLFDRYGDDYQIDSLGRTLVIDSIGQQTRPIHQGRAYLFDGVDDYVALATTLSSSLERSYFNRANGIVRFTWIPSRVDVRQSLFSIGSNDVNTGEGSSGISFRILEGGNVIWVKMFGSSPIYFTLPFIVQIGVAYDIIFYFDNATNQCGVYWNGTFLVTGECLVLYNATENGTVIGAEWFTYTTNSTFNYQQGKIFAWQYYPYSASILTNLLAYNQYQMLPNAGCLAFYKCDEQAGAIAYDSSGNEKYGVINNATINTFHSTQNLYSYQNEVGYNYQNTGVYIPRNESDISKDILGNNLTFFGRVKYNAFFKNSNCATFSGSQYIDFGITPATELSNFIVSFWANPGGSFPYSTLACVSYNDDSGTGRGGYRIRKGPNNSIMMDAGNGGGILAQTNTTFSNPNIWYHFILVYNAGAGQFYVNGVADGSPVTAGLNYPPVGGPKKTGLGCMLADFNQSNPTSFWEGGLAGFQIAEYSASNLSKALAQQNLDNVVFYAPLAEGGGFTAYDVSGNGRHGRIMNATLYIFWGMRQNFLHYNLMKGNNGPLYYTSNFDISDDGWYVINGTKSIVNDPSNSSNKVLKTVRVGTDICSTRYALSGLVAGLFYSYSFRIRLLVCGNANQQLYFRHKIGVAFISVGNGDIISVNDGWLTINGSFQATDETDFTIQSTGEAGLSRSDGDTWLIDDVSIVQEAYVPALLNNPTLDAAGRIVSNQVKPRSFTKCETQIDFTSEIASPYATLSGVPSAYTASNTFQDNNRRFNCSISKLNNYLIYPTAITNNAVIAKIKNYLKQP